MKRAGSSLTFLYDPSYKERAVNASNAIQAKTVSCYDLKGQWLATFTSILKASKKTGIRYANIRYALQHPYHLMGGFYWRKGDDLVIDLAEKPGKDYRETRGSRITKFDLEGNPLERYLAISEAAKLNNISHRSIMQNVNNESENAGGFIWRLGHHYKKLKL